MLGWGTPIASVLLEEAFQAATGLWFSKLWISVNAERRVGKERGNENGGEEGRNGYAGYSIMDLLTCFMSALIGKSCASFVNWLYKSGT